MEFKETNVWLVLYEGDFGTTSWTVISKERPTQEQIIKKFDIELADDNEYIYIYPVDMDAATSLDTSDLQKIKVVTVNMEEEDE